MPIHNFILFLSIVIMSAMLIASCGLNGTSDDPWTSPPYSGNPSAVFSVMRPYVTEDDSVYVDGRIYCDFRTAAYSNLTLLDSSPGCIHIPYDTFYMGRVLPLESDNKVSLIIRESEGFYSDILGESELVFPDTFCIIQPVEYYTNLQVGDDFEVTWSQSQGAEKYCIYFRFSYEYVSFSNDTIYHEFFEDTENFTDTVILFTGQELFGAPEDVESIIYGSGYFSLRARTGSYEGESQNIEGQIPGYFSADYWCGDRRVTLTE